MLSKNEFDDLGGLADSYIKELFEKRQVSPKQQQQLWQYYYNTLNKALDIGYHPSVAHYDVGLADRLKNNIAQFSAFKQEAFGQVLKEAMVNKNGLVSWDDFKKQAKKISTQYNSTWLKTEFHQTKANAKATADYQNYQAEQDLYPNLKYIAVQDGRTRDAHRALHGTIAAVNDPIWSDILPPNDWGCRCNVLQTDEQVTVPTVPKTVNDAVPKTFQNNPAKSGEIFKSDSMAYMAILPPKLISKVVKFAENMLQRTQLKEIVTYKNGGKVAVHKQRIRHSKISKNETLKYQKELRMAKVYAKNGHEVIMLKEVPGVSSPDVLFDNIPAELKSVASHNNIAKYAKKAINTQGAEMVLFEFEVMTENIQKELNKLKKRGIKVSFYSKDDYIVHSL